MLVEGGSEGGRAVVGRGWRSVTCGYFVVEATLLTLISADRHVFLVDDFYLFRHLFIAVNNVLVVSALQVGCGEHLGIEVMAVGWGETAYFHRIRQLSFCLLRLLVHKILDFIQI